MPVSRGAALLLAGVWLGLLVASWVAATATFRRRGPRPGARDPPGAVVPASHRSPPTTGGSFFATSPRRSTAGCSNAWGWLRLALAVVLLAATWTAEGCALVALAVAAVAAIVQAGLAPAIESLGRSIDFVARPLPPTWRGDSAPSTGPSSSWISQRRACSCLAGHLLARLPLK